MELAIQIISFICVFIVAHYHCKDYKTVSGVLSAVFVVSMTEWMFGEYAAISQFLLIIFCFFNILFSEMDGDQEVYGFKQEDLK